MARYSVNSGYVVLDENSDLVDWFDTEEDANKFIENEEKIEAEILKGKQSKT